MKINEFYHQIFIKKTFVARFIKSIVDWLKTAMRDFKILSSMKKTKMREHDA